MPFPLRSNIAVLGLGPQFVDKIQMLLSVMSERFLMNVQQKLGNNERNGTDYAQFITIKSLNQIIRSAMEFVRVSAQEEEVTKPFDALRASFDIFFKAILMPEVFELYKMIFQLIFVDEATSIRVTELVESRLFLDPLKEYFIIKKLDLHEKLIKVASIFLNFVQQKRPILIAGKPGR